MESRSGSGATGQLDDAVREALDRLYAAPLEGFVALRRETVASLRASGHGPASRLIASAAKPSRTAWAMNQVARQRPELLRSTFDAWAKAASDQTKPSDGEGDALRSSARAFREALAKVVQAAGELAREAGTALTAEQGRRMGATLQAVSSEPESPGRAALLEGRLVADVDIDDPFAGLELGPTGRLHAPQHPESPSRDELAPRRAAAAEAARAAERRRAGEAEKQKAAQRERELRAQALEKARSRVTLLEAEAKEARASARQAEVVAARAKADAERARREVDSVEKSLDEAIKDLQRLTT